MTVRVYRSTDASAPVLSGTAGTLQALFYAVLVTGYGSMTAAGWAREFVSGNIAAFRAASGNRLRLRLDDTSTQEARVVGYETMSDVNTGTGLFPTNGQVSGGLFIRKSNTADATARPWVMIASSTGFYFLPAAGETDWLTVPAASGATGQFFFGDFASFKAGDVYNTCIIGSEVGGTTTGRLGIKTVPATSFIASAGHYIARPYYGIGQSIQFCKMCPQALNAGTALGSAGGIFPDPISGGMLLSAIYIIENGPNNLNYSRGILPGMWDLNHTSAGTHGDIYSGTGESAGKSFLMASLFNASTIGRVAMEISDTW